MTTFREQFEESIPLLSDQDLADQTDPTRRGTGMKPKKKRYLWNEIPELNIALTSELLAILEVNQTADKKTNKGYKVFPKYQIKSR